MSLKKSTQAGDTLVEVLVAVAVLAVVLVGTFSLMNKGVTQMYDSMERSEVRLLLDRQTEALSYARDEFFIRDSGDTSGYVVNVAAANAWQTIRTEALVPSLSTVPALEDGCSTTTGAFAITRDGSNNLAISAITQAKATGFPSPGDGIWIQKISSPTGLLVPYKDFYIRACWWPTGSLNMQVMSTVVRLYDK